MRRAGALLAVLALLPCACSPTPPSGRGLKHDVLDDAIGIARPPDPDAAHLRRGYRIDSRPA